MPKQENDFVSILKTISSYQLEEERLTLLGESGVLIFEPLQPEGTPIPFDGFYDVDWDLVALENDGGILPANDISLRMSRFTATGSGGCNIYSAEPSIIGAANIVEFASLVHGSESCGFALDEQERIYFEILSRVQSFSLSEDTLILFASNGTLTFNAATPNEPISSTPQSTATIQPTPPPPSPTAEPESWLELSSMRISRSEMPALVWNGRLSVPGGFGNGFVKAHEQVFEAYVFATDSWVRLADTPFPVNHHGFAEHDGHFYLFPDRKQPVLRYDPAQDSWTELAPMPESRWAGTAVSLNNHIYYVGGAGGTNALLRYDPATDSWDTLAELNQSREHSQAVVLNGEIYALGGRWQRALNQVEIYNPEADAWRRGPSMTQPRSGFGATVSDGKIVVAGGELLSPLNTLDSIELFDPTTNRWELASIILPTPLHGFSMVTYEGSLFVVGGSGLAGDVSNRGRLYALPTLPNSQ